MPLHTRPWLRHLSFNFNLNQIALAVFRVGDNLKTAQDNIPVLGELLRNIQPADHGGVGHAQRSGGDGWRCWSCSAWPPGSSTKRVKPE